MTGPFVLTRTSQKVLLCVVNDARAALDRQKGLVLVLIDLSAAFDTIDHCILLVCLHECFGLDGLVCAWLKSCLSNRTQRMVIGDASSGPLSLDMGIPQGVTFEPPTLLPLCTATSRWYCAVPWPSVPSLCQWSSVVPDLWPQYWLSFSHPCQPESQHTIRHYVLLYPGWRGCFPHDFDKLNCASLKSTTGWSSTS